MEVKHFTNKNNHTIYFVVENDGTVVKPVYDYMLFLARSKKSLNTIQNCAYSLRLYFEWLSSVNLTYKTAVESKSKTNKGAIMNLSEFMFWLEYPDKNNKVIPIDGVQAARTPQTINQIMSHVHGFYRFASKNEGINSFPDYEEIQSNSQYRGFLSEMAITKKKQTKTPLKMKTKKKVPKYITLDEYRKMMEQANCLRDKVILALMYDGGLRVSEVIGLHIEDLHDIYKNQIHITLREDYENRDASVKYGSVGTVFVSDNTRDLIIDYINNYLSFVDTNLVVFNLYGETRLKPMKRNNIEKLVKAIAKRAKIDKNITLHMFRHGTAVLMFNNGCTMQQIQSKLRHTSPTTTANVYAEFDEFSRKEAMQTVYNKSNQKFTPDGLSLDDVLDWLTKEDNIYE